MIRLYLDDTLSLDVHLTDDTGSPVDLTDATVDIVSSPVGLEGAASVVDPPTDGHFTFTRAADAAGIYSLRYRISWSGGPVVTEPGETVRVVDPDSQWATLGDIEAIFGPQDDPDAVYRAIDAATALIKSWLCVPVPEPLPPEFTMATVLVAGRLLAAPAPGSPISETIGDYSYRLATGPSPEALRSEIRHLLGPWLCGNLHSVRVWPGGPDRLPCEAGAWAWDLWGEYQPDAEGLLRS